jgi:hypothetical protein
MGSPWEKDFSHLDTRSQLYLRAYQEQNHRHKLFRGVYKAFALLAVLIPPLSLLFTIQAAIEDSKKEKFSLLKNIGFCMLFAFIPGASGIMSWHLIKDLEEVRRQKDKIQKKVFTEEELKNHKAYLTWVKTKMQEWDVDLKSVKPKAEEKNQKIKLEYDENGQKFAVYMDAAQKERESQLLECGIVLYQLKNNMITKEEARERISNTPKFFKEKHEESVRIINGLKTQYSI